MDDFDDGIWSFPDDVWVIAGSLWRMPAFTCRPVSPSIASPASYAASSCRSQLVKPAARLIFTPWVFGKSMRTAIHA
jgi:hypothetical protein